MFEFLLEPVAEGFASLAIGILKKGGQSVGNKLQHVNASRKYIQKYRKNHCELSVLGMRDPVDLAAVYTGVKLLKALRWGGCDRPQATMCE